MSSVEIPYARKYVPSNHIYRQYILGPETHTHKHTCKRHIIIPSISQPPSIHPFGQAGSQSRVFKTFYGQIRSYSNALKKTTEAILGSFYVFSSLLNPLWYSNPIIKKCYLHKIDHVLKKRNSSRQKTTSSLARQRLHGTCMGSIQSIKSVSYTHLTLPTIYSV